MHGVAVLTLAHRWGSSRSVLLAICSAVCKLLQPWDMVLHLACRGARLSLLVAQLLLLCSFALDALPAKRHAMEIVCLWWEQLGQDSVWTHISTQLPCFVLACCPAPAPKLTGQRPAARHPP